jgi:hypothetical protein
MGGQHFNGQAERIIGILKRQLHRSFEGKKYTHKETCTVVQEEAQIVNSYPLVMSLWAGRNLSAQKILCLGEQALESLQPAMRLACCWSRNFSWCRKLRKTFEIGGFKRYSSCVVKKRCSYQRVLLCENVSTTIWGDQLCVTVFVQSKLTCFTVREQPEQLFCWMPFNYNKMLMFVLVFL